VSSHLPLDLVGKPTEMLMQPVEHVALVAVSGEMADQRGVRGVSTKLLERSEVIIHGIGP
jgi:hypothetical protein